MSTVCFDIKRVDDNYVCIQHCNTDTFQYQYHLPLSFYPRKRKEEDRWWLTDKKYRYIWIVIEKEDSGIEKPVWACNDKIWLNRSIKEFFKDKNIRIIKLPFEIKDKYTYDNKDYVRFVTNDLSDNFKLYCPIDLNEKYHTYYDHYEEIEPTIEIIEGFEFKTRNFKWVPPKMLGEE